MSTITQGIDARAYLSGWLEGLVSMYSADIAAIPDDKWHATFGGCTRPASELTADAIGMLSWTTQALNGNLDADYEAAITERFKTSCATKEGAANALRTTAEEFNRALASASDETLNKIVAPPWKMDAPLFMLAQIAVSHIWYHDGQLNYIQCLLGDEKIHWMGD
ncbi:MAG TPA: hypothetical protein PLL78_04600 [Fimbriimonadaceae bacterium]|nr:hypothetical protein [Fimbriimonadaceae bacterium]HRJ95943.1 hypothetical protein [Fimbriimonadaceae bacterium]